MIIIADAISLYPPELYEKGLEIVTVSVLRTHPAALNPRIKSLNYLNNILAKIEGLQAGCIEALMLNHKGEIAECTGDNIFLVRKGVLYTPPIDAGILEGVTRDAVIELAREAGIEVREIPLTKHDVYIADEVLPHRHGRRSDPRRESRQPHDRHRQTGPDDARPQEAVPRADAGMSQTIRPFPEMASSFASTDERWQHIIEEHAELAGLRDEVLGTICRLPSAYLSGAAGELLAAQDVRTG